MLRKPFISAAREASAQALGRIAGNEMFNGFFNVHDSIFCPLKRKRTQRRRCNHIGELGVDVESFTCSQLRLRFLDFIFITTIIAVFKSNFHDANPAPAR